MVVCCEDVGDEIIARLTIINSKKRQTNKERMKRFVWALILQSLVDDLEDFSRSQVMPRQLLVVILLAEVNCQDREHCKKISAKTFSVR